MTERQAQRLVRMIHGPRVRLAKIPKTIKVVGIGLRNINALQFVAVAGDGMQYAMMLERCGPPRRRKGA